MASYAETTSSGGIETVFAIAFQSEQLVKPIKKEHL